MEILILRKVYCKQSAAYYFPNVSFNQRKFFIFTFNLCFSHCYIITQTEVKDLSHMFTYEVTPAGGREV